MPCIRLLGTYHRTRLNLDFEFSFQWLCAHPNLHSFPTRRSSDLVADLDEVQKKLGIRRFSLGSFSESCRVFEPQKLRSEEHTSELQSRLQIVCRLLPEKKKNGSSNHRKSADEIVQRNTHALYPPIRHLPPHTFESGF